MLKPQAVLEKMNPSDTNIFYALTLIRVGFLGVRFEVDRVGKLPPPLPPPLKQTW